MKAETPRPSQGCARGAALRAHELKAPTVSVLRRPHHSIAIAVPSSGTLATTTSSISISWLWSDALGGGPSRPLCLIRRRGM